MQAKECPRCGNRYPPAEFHKNKARKDGLSQYCKSCSNSYKKENPEHQRAAERSYHKRLRDEFFDHYGDACVCCGEEVRALLTIEHRYGDGAEDRKKIAPLALIRKLKQLDWPQNVGLEVLCYSCNIGSYHNGGRCPHEDVIDGVK